ncbi:sulfotransferase [Flavobacterium sp. DGU11]|uniref:Sulfotransferase n=1 Tax=Flavobacterium arundinis TaxID=3139143 RepID=A0ABU9HTC7_9FLAO
MVPDFILGGAMKSGTTFLNNLLLNHPDIIIIDRNMDHAYFDDDRIFKRGKEWYLSLFEKALKDKKEGTVIGQTSADVNFNPGSVKKILEHNPDMKLIFVLRHPIERTYSLYWHQYGMGREYLNFEKALKKEPEKINKSYHNFKHYSFLERSRYAKQFKDIVGVVPDKNLLILDFESLTSHTKESVNVVLDFLGVARINDVEELNFSKLPRNPAKIPTSHAIVLVSAFLQKLGMEGIGRRLLYKFRKEVRPPKMNPDTRIFLEETELKDDIQFFEKVKSDFEAKIGKK